MPQCSYKVSSALTINRSGTLLYGNTVTVVIICILQLRKLRDQEDKCLGGLGTIIKQEMLRCNNWVFALKALTSCCTAGCGGTCLQCQHWGGWGKKLWDRDKPRPYLCLRIAQASMLPRLKRHGKITAFQSIELGVRLTEALSPGNCGNRACYFTSPN